MATLLALGDPVLLRGMGVGHVRGTRCLGPGGFRPVCFGHGIVGELAGELPNRLGEQAHLVCRPSLPHGLLLPLVTFGLSLRRGAQGGRLPPQPAPSAQRALAADYGSTVMCCKFAPSAKDAAGSIAMVQL
ncbi:hypothetical protein [Streptomyces sp. NPDC014733]|uniref:hypothetical protein n=1 Tax=Streptomyces sp. NPDC014733 TaxID=3364885 RepID=UPI0036F7B360